MPKNSENNKNTSKSGTKRNTSSKNSVGRDIIPSKKTGTSGAAPAKSIKLPPNPDSLGNQIILCVIGLAAILLFVILILTDMSKGTSGMTGPVGYAISAFFHGMFGNGAYFFPFLLFCFAAMWKESLRRRSTGKKAMSTALVNVLISSLIHLVYIAMKTEEVVSVKFYDLAGHWNTGLHSRGGGMFGGFIAGGLTAAIKVIAWPVIILALIIVIMVMFELSPNMIFGLIRQHGRNSAEKRRARAERKKVENQEKKIEKEEQRRELAARRAEEAEAKAAALREREQEFERRHSRQGVTDIALPGDEQSGDPAGAQESARSRDAKKQIKDLPVYQDDGKKKRDINDNEISILDEADKKETSPDAPTEQSREGSENTRRTVRDININDVFTDAPAKKGRPLSDINGNENPVTADSGDEPGVEEILSVDMTIQSKDGESGAARPASPSGADSRAGVKTSRSRVVEQSAPEPVRPSYILPPLSLLTLPDLSLAAGSDKSALDRNGRRLVETLRSFHVEVDIVNISQGPTITRYELVPKAGVRVRSIANLVDDIALNLETQGIRIEAPIPGKAAVGIEVPNKESAIVYLRELLDTETFRNAKSKLFCCLGKNVSGEPVYLDIAKMPHLLIAGATGMGKSVCINSLLISLLYKSTPDEVKLILIDPKKVELGVYNKLPHLLVPVVNQPKMAAGSLAWAVTEMERRFELIEEVGVRDIAGYNKIADAEDNRERLPQIVIVIDELADLMMTAPVDVEASICRLAQKARAAGMHLILGTQRPSVDVITGLIKANIPSRIAFTVASNRDSMTIIDVAGAEKLIGRGDMLYNPVGAMKPIRVQGSFVSDSDVEKVTDFIKDQASAAVSYDEGILKEIDRNAKACGQKKKSEGAPGAEEGSGETEQLDEKFDEAVEIALEEGKISTSLLQRRISIGYGRAAKIIDAMAKMHIVSAPDGQKPRNTLISRQAWLEMKSSSGGDDVGADDAFYDDDAEDDLPPDSGSPYSTPSRNDRARREAPGPGPDEDRPFTEDDFDDDAPF